MTGPRRAVEPRTSRAGRALHYLPALTLAAVVTVTSTSEWTLARTVLDLPPAVAWAVPVAIDSYVIAALRTRRDVGAAITVMAGALAAAMGAHLAAASRADGTLPAEVTAPAAAVILSVLVIVAWRVHVLIDHLADAPTDTAAGTPPSTATAEVRVSPLGEYGTAEHPAALPASTEPGPPQSVRVGAATPPRPASPTSAATATRAALTDEQILADLRTTTHGASPGIRALKRTYAIGQTRAARIHQQITDGPTDQKTPRKSQQENSSATDHQKAPAESRETDHESAPKQNQESDTGITDRVGPPAEPTEMRSTASRNGHQAVPGHAGRPELSPSRGGER